MKVIALLVGFCLLSSHAFAQFNRVEVLPEEDMMGLYVSGKNMLAASARNVLYRSSNGGATWDSVFIDAGKSINTMGVIDGEIYLGTASHGIYTSKNNGQSWSLQSGIQYPVVQIKKVHNELYAATDGAGLFKLNTSSNRWELFHYEPQASNVNGIFELKSTLMFAGGGNGTWFRFDENQAKWTYGFYFGTLAPGLQIDRCYQAGDTLYATTSRYVLKSVDDGRNWETDDQGARRGIDRLMIVEQGQVYLLANSPQGGCWLQRKNEDQLWEDVTFLSGLYVYHGIVSDGGIWLATNKGIFTNRDLQTGITPIPGKKNATYCFPQPVAPDADWQVESEHEVVKAETITADGRLLATQLVEHGPVQGKAPAVRGMYYLRLTLVSGEVLYEKLLVY